MGQEMTLFQLARLLRRQVWKNMTVRPRRQHPLNKILSGRFLYLLPKW